MTATLALRKLVRSFSDKGVSGTLKSCTEHFKEIRFDRKFGLDTWAASPGEQVDYTIPEGCEPDLHLSYSPTKIETLKKIFVDLQVC